MRIVLALALLLTPATLAAQRPGQPVPGAPSSPDAPKSDQPSSNWNQKIQQLSFGASSSEDYRLGNGDLIEVNVIGVDNFKHQVRVNTSGMVTLPYVGSVHVAGLSAMEVEEKLKSMLDEKYIKNPQLTVFVVEYRSQPVFVLGAVQRPGQYQMASSLRLIDAIALAGGLNTETAAGIAIIQRKPSANNTARTSGGPADGAPTNPTANSGGQLVAKPGVDATTVALAAEGSQNIRIDLRDLLEGGKTELNVPIEAGDVVQIPEKQIARFYVIGDVNRPGAYELPNQEQVFVTQALAWAGGPMRTAKKSKGMLVRYDERGGRQELALNVDDIMKGKKADVKVQPNDVIFLPGSTAKNIGYGLLGVIPGTVASTVVYGTVRR